jgi:hypothetical protein
MDDLFFTDFDVPSEPLQDEEEVIYLASDQNNVDAEIDIRNNALEEYITLRLVEIGADEAQYRDQQYLDLVERVMYGDILQVQEFAAMCKEMVDKQVMVGSPNESIHFEYDDDLMVVDQALEQQATTTV